MAKREKQKASVFAETSMKNIAAVFIALRRDKLTRQEREKRKKKREKRKEKKGYDNNVTISHAAVSSL